MREPEILSPAVAVVGSVNLDIVAELDHLPLAGETVFARTVRRNIGGKGANQAVAAGIGGATVEFVGRIGDDPTGSTLRAGLESLQVGTAGLRSTAAAASGTAYICVADGENTIVVDAGANWEWAEPNAHDQDTVRQADVVVCQMEIPDAALVWAAHNACGRFMLNAAPARTVPGEVLTHCDPLVVNEHELAQLTGQPAGDLASAARAQRLLMQRGARSVVTTLGATGAAYTDGERTYHQPAPCTRVRDTTGAGDAFMGILAARLAHGSSLGEAVAWATAAASLSVQRPGTYDAYPSSREIADALADLPEVSAVSLIEGAGT